MEVYFRTNQLQHNYEQSARAIRRWGPEVGRKYITRINELLRVTNLQETYKIRAMRLHSLKGPEDGSLSIYLAGRWRLIVTADDTEESVVIEEVSNHYDD